jgi:hypothetical protein
MRIPSLKKWTRRESVRVGTVLAIPFLAAALATVPSTNSFYYKSHTTTGSFASGEWPVDEPPPTETPYSTPAACTWFHGLGSEDPQKKVVDEGYLAKVVTESFDAGRLLSIEELKGDYEIVVLKEDGVDPLTEGAQSGVEVRLTPTRTWTGPQTAPTKKLGWIVFVESGDWKVTGSAGKDILIGGPGKNVFSGANGRDCLVGGSGSNHFTGDNQGDLLIGGLGATNVFDGRNAKDIVIGGATTDALDGGHAPDIIVWRNLCVGNPRDKHDRDWDWFWTGPVNSPTVTKCSAASAAAIEAQADPTPAATKQMAAEAEKSSTLSDSPAPAEDRSEVKREVAAPADVEARPLENSRSAASEGRQDVDAGAVSDDSGPVADSDLVEQDAGDS